jgi:hypothetical protein
MLKKAFGEQALSQARTFEWLKCFKGGWNLWTIIIFWSTVHMHNSGSYFESA